LGGDKGSPNNYSYSPTSRGADGEKVNHAGYLHKYALQKHNRRKNKMKTKTKKLKKNKETKQSRKWYFSGLIAGLKNEN